MIKPIYYSLLFLTFFIPAFCQAQKFVALKTYNVDSLQSLLPWQDGQEKINTLNNLAVSLFFSDSALCKIYSDQAMALARSLNYENGIAEAYRNYGFLQFIKGNHPDALKNLFEALSIFEKTDQKRKVEDMYQFIARIHYFARNYDKTIEFGFLALEYCSECCEDGPSICNLKDTVLMDLGLAQTYVEMQRRNEAIELRKKCLESMRQHQYPTIEIMATTWTIGASYFTNGKTDSAKTYLLRALDMPGEDINIVAQKHRAWLWLSDVLFATGETDSAFSVINRTLKWYDDNGFLLWALYSSNYMGRFYYRTGDWKNAEKHFLESEEYLDEMLARNSQFRNDSLKDTTVHGFEIYFPIPVINTLEAMWSWGAWAYFELYRIYNRMHNSPKALAYHILYTNAADSLDKIMHQKETVEFQTRYEADQKERQIQDLSEQNAFKSYKLRQSRIFMFGLAGLITLVILLALALLRQGRLHEKQNSLILQQKLFRAQMDPHFIFNSLSSIHHFMINEKPAKAASYLSKFSKLIRNILQGSVQEYTSLSNEIGIIENYLELQRLRFPGKFDFTVEVDEELDPDHVSIPSMITQPFVENAIEHGIRYKEQKGMVAVSFTLKNDMIAIVVEDDGIGREKAATFQAERDKDHHSLATSLILSRIKVLNRTLKKKITLDILDLEDEQGLPAGTKVILDVPLR